MHKENLWSPLFKVVWDWTQKGSLLRIKRKKKQESRNRTETSGNLGQHSGKIANMFESPSLFWGHLLQPTVVNNT